MDIADLVRAIDSGRVRVTRHASFEAAADSILLEAVWASVKGGRIIEAYPTDRPHPSCLIFGLAQDGSPIHSVWAYNEKNQWAVLVTVYRPDPDRWVEWVERRKL